MTDLSLEKTLPNNLEAERAVLGACLLEDKAVFTASAILTAEDFYLEADRRIFICMLALLGDGQPIDTVLLLNELRRRDWLESVGGPAYVASLTDYLGSVNVNHYCRIIRELSISRQMIRISNEIMTRCFQGEEKPREILERVQSELLALYGREQEHGLVPMSDVVTAGVHELETRKAGGDGNSIATGLYDIDRNTGGLRPKSLIILAARPAQGKSALAGNIALNAGKKGKRVAVFSLEMGQTELYDRMLASEAGMNCFDLVRGQVRADEWPRIHGVNERLYPLPIAIDDSGSLSMLQLRARASREKAEKGLDLVVVDYLQLIQGPGKSIYERVTEVSRALKILAKDLDVPVLALSQLHRLQDESGEPGLQDLKESGAIEQDADMVLFLWPSKIEGIKQFKIGKQRNGPLCTLNLGWDNTQTRFYNCARDLYNGESSSRERAS